MQRFIITNPTKFTGQAEIIYNAAGVLCKIDCTDTNMDADTIAAFKRTVSPRVETVYGVFSETTQILKADIVISFEMWWKKYCKKINKIRTLGLWNKLSQTDQVLAYLGIDPYEKYLKREGWRGKADPETYLRNRYWENEYK